MMLISYCKMYHYLKQFEGLDPRTDYDEESSNCVAYISRDDSANNVCGNCYHFQWLKEDYKACYKG